MSEAAATSLRPNPFAEWVKAWQDRYNPSGDPRIEVAARCISPNEEHGWHTAARIVAAIDAIQVPQQESPAVAAARRRGLKPSGGG